MIPNKFFLTKGAGIHKEELTSFEMALRDAGIEKYNLVFVSSILPPSCRRITKEEGMKELKSGQIVYCVVSRNQTNEPNRLIVAAVGCAVPAEESNYGYISEHHAFGETEEHAGEYAEDLAASMLATNLGIEFDPSVAWDEREKIYKMSGKIIKSSNITQSARGNKDGFWTTVVAAVIFVF